MSTAIEYTQTIHTATPGRFCRSAPLRAAAQPHYNSRLVYSPKPVRDEVQVVAAGAARNDDSLFIRQLGEGLGRPRLANLSCHVKFDEVAWLDWIGEARRGESSDLDELG